jgi:hypothetical protein
MDQQNSQHRSQWFAAGDGDLWGCWWFILVLGRPTLSAIAPCSRSKRQKLRDRYGLWGPSVLLSALTPQQGGVNYVRNNPTRFRMALQFHFANSAS